MRIAGMSGVMGRVLSAGGAGGALPASLDAFDLLVAKPSATFTAGATATWDATKGTGCRFEQATGSAQPAYDATDDALDCAGDDFMSGDADIRSILNGSYDDFTAVWVGKFSDTSGQACWQIGNNITSFYAEVRAFDSGSSLTALDRRVSTTTFARKTSGTASGTLYCVVTRHRRNAKLTLNVNSDTKVDSAANVDNAAAVAAIGNDQPTLSKLTLDGSGYFLRGDMRLFGVKKGTVLTDGEVSTLISDIATYLGVTFT